jgi:hypothetical protein
MQDPFNKRQNGCDEESETKLLLEMEEFKMLERKKSMSKTYLILYVKYFAKK